MFHLIYCELVLLISLQQVLKMLQEILFQHRVLPLKLTFCVYISITLTLIPLFVYLSITLITNAPAAYTTPTVQHCGPTDEVCCQ